MKVVVCLSGGIDSTVLAYFLDRAGCNVTALTFDYGQTHAKEIEHAKYIAEELRIQNHVLDFRSAIVLGKSALTGGEGSPVVLNRNATMLSLAVTFAAGIGAEHVYYGPTSEDYDLFPDCRPEFVESFNAMLESSQTPCSIIAPFINNTKRDIVEMGKLLGVPLDKTWSCYEGGEEPCGTCLACTTREEALVCI